MPVADSAARRACADYLKLRDLFWKLPHDHPARPALAEAVARADRHWRDLATQATYARPVSDPPPGWATALGADDRP